MRRMIRWGVAAAAIAVSAGSVDAQDRFEWRGEMSSGSFIEVRGISGDIEATLASGGSAEVIGVKEGRSRDFDDVQIVAFEENGGVVICAIYGERRRSNSCDSRDDDRNWGGNSKNIDVSVDFTVRVPAGVDFIGKTVSGDVEAEGLEGDVEGTTVSGNVVISTTGIARATTVSGDLDIEMGSLDWERMTFNTVSGDIDVTMPSDLSAEIDFESLSGDFRTSYEFDVTRHRDKMVGLEIEGVIGSGARSLKFHTVSGDVTLRTSRSSSR